MEDFYIDYSAMDEIQRPFIDRKVNHHMVVTGTAGTGKSVIALHKLRQVSTKGSYAIIVYTKSLKKYFVDGIKAMIRDRLENYGETINLNCNCVFYYQEWSEWRWRNPGSRVDYLIVDECQDFTPEQINRMLAFGRICFLFGDADQTIMDFDTKITMNPEQTAKSLGVRAERLYYNYRLTIETAKVVEQVPHPQVVTDVSTSCVRHGEKPRLIKATSFDGQLDRIIEIIHNRALTNVGILLRFNTKEKAYNKCRMAWKSVEYVKDYFQGKGITVEYKYNINRDTDMDLDFHSSNPKILTWWCAKGLQFKDVFVVDCDCDYVSQGLSDKERRTYASAWYVALSRTSERLYICYTGSLSNRFPVTTSDLYSNPDRVSTIDDDLPF